jgi:acyl carrier protein
MVTLEEVTAAVRAEVAKHVLRDDFGNADDFTRDLQICSDDLTSIALSLENRFGLKIGRREYRRIHNVLNLASAFYERLSAQSESLTSASSSNGTKAGSTS